MRKALLLLGITLSLFTTTLFGQLPIKGLSSILTKIGSSKTMVVTSSDSFEDIVFVDGVRSNWRISPYQICSIEEYEKIKGDSSYFFLMRVDGKYRGQEEPQIEYLTFFRGGEVVNYRFFNSDKIVMLPLQSAGGNEGALFSLIPLYLDVIQNFLYRIKGSTKEFIKWELVAPEGVTTIGSKSLLFPLSYLSYSTTEEEFKKLFNYSDKVSIVDNSSLEKAFTEAKEGVVLPLLISPKEVKSGSYCYKLLVELSTHKLLYFRKHKITPWRGVGFTREDMRTLSTPYHF